MSIVKKWTSCVISFIAGVLGLALSACSGMIIKTSFDATSLNPLLKNTSTEVVKSYKVITDSSLYTKAKAAGIETEFVWLKVFAIITLIVSILLIAYAIVMLLKNLNVIKSSHSAFGWAGIALVVLLLVATIGLLITSNIYTKVADTLAISEVCHVLTTEYHVPEIYLSAIPMTAVAKIGIYQPIMLTVAIVSAIAVAVVEFLKKKSK